MKLKLQKYDYETPSKTPKTGLKGAIRNVIIGFILMIFAIVGVNLDATEKDNLLPMILALLGLLFIIYGFLKLLKIMWDNIPE